jgi:hypothetical protein
MNGVFNLFFVVLGVVLVRCEHCICFITTFFVGVRDPLLHDCFVRFLILTHPHPLLHAWYFFKPFLREYSPVHLFTATHNTHQHHIS